MILMCSYSVPFFLSITIGDCISVEWCYLILKNFWLRPFVLLGGGLVPFLEKLISNSSTQDINKSFVKMKWP
uniref:Uncharacterized protein n=1 Tax=Rhizophora mucronata TaxID=61149 RepID=A0A2P2QFZ9_RHIMU